jgi:chromosome segregation ATPase
VGAGGPDAEPGRRLAVAVTEEIGETEKDVLYLETLIDREKLLDLKALGEQLKRDRRELASLIEQFKQTKDPKTQDSILQEIQAMKGRIGELMQRMAELAKGIRDEHMNQEAVAEMMQDQNMSGALDEVERLMREGKADEALAKLQELAMQMDKMLENLDDAEDKSGEDYPELSQKFQAFMEQLEKTRTEQDRVALETKALRDAQREKLKERLAQKGQALKDELIKKSEEVMKDYQSLRADRMSSRADKPLEEAQGELDNVKNALKVDDFDLAAEAAARAASAAAELKQLGEQQKQLDQLFQNPPDAKRTSRELAERLGKNASKVEDISQKLQQLFPQAGSALTEADKQKLKELSGQQRQLEQAAQQLQQKMDEMAQMAPLFGEEAQSQMNQVGEKMGNAAQRMEGKDPGRGYGEQKSALDQLSQLEKQMKQSGQGKGKKGGGLPLPMLSGRREGNGRNNSEKVEIPDADQFQAPKEFRKDLLDAMKQGAPDKYKEQVKRYYEELVK